MYKKVWCTRKIVLLIKPTVFFLRSGCGRVIGSLSPQQLNSPSPVTIPEVFAKGYSTQFLFRFYVKNTKQERILLFHDNTYRNSLLNFLLLWFFLPFSKLNVQKKKKNKKHRIIIIAMICNTIHSYIIFVCLLFDLKLEVRVESSWKTLRLLIRLTPNSANLGSLRSRHQLVVRKGRARETREGEGRLPPFLPSYAREFPRNFFPHP